MPDKPQTPLFRKQALAHKRRALYGDVILKASLSSWVLTACLVAIMAIVVCALLFGQVQTDDGPQALWRWLKAYLS